MYFSITNHMLKQGVVWRKLYRLHTIFYLQFDYNKSMKNELISSLLSS